MINYTYTVIQLLSWSTVYQVKQQTLVHYNMYKYKYIIQWTVEYKYEVGIV